MKCTPKVRHFKEVLLLYKKGEQKMEKSKKEQFKVVEDKPRNIKAELEAEREELQAKAERLQKFTQGEEFKALPYAERRLMAEQFNIMASYIDCLTARISIKK